MTANTSVLASTFFLTLLLMVGLFFFIRASVKDRTKQIEIVTEAPEALVNQLQTYFEGRAYQVTAADTAQNQLTFKGFVRPSWFLALFLSLLAGTGFLCLALVLALLFPSWRYIFFALPLLAPAAGFFYWKKAGRVEQIRLKVEALTEPEPQSQVTVTAHRDELIQLQQVLSSLEGRRKKDE